MPSFTIKVPNNDEGEDLGEFESEYLPRVGDSMTVWHRRLSGKRDTPFCGIVSAVTHEAFHTQHPYAHGDSSRVVTTVWVVEELGAPTLYCDCSPQEREQHGVKDGQCENCGHVREA